MTSPPGPGPSSYSPSSSLSLTNRLRSGSSSTSLALLSPGLAHGSASASSPYQSRSTTPNPSSSSTGGRSLSKGYRPRYHYRSHSSFPSSSHAHLGKPKVLPFPDLPVRPISRDGSRAGSPTRTSRSASGSSTVLPGSGPGTGSGQPSTGIGSGSGSGMSSPSPTASPIWTPRGSSSNLSDIGIGGSAAGHPGADGHSTDGTATGTGTIRAGRSAHVIRFDTAHASGGGSDPALASASTPHLGLPAESSRPRALTSPGPVDIPVPRHQTPSDPPTSMFMSASASATGPNPLNNSDTSAIYTSPSSLPNAASGSSYPGHRPPPTPEKDRPVPPVKPQKKLSVNSIATITHSSGAVPITPAPPAQPLQDHLYRAFITGECADVRLWVRKWGIAWHVHKMVLVQAGFFHSLFLGGFSETSMTARYSSRKGKERATHDDRDDDDWIGEDVELTFDDPNITRAAFEICLSRLYSSHPRLHHPSALLPTPTHPLTPAFSWIPAAPPYLPSYPRLEAALPPQTHLATPHLLLSLLATTIYLGHAALMREVLAMVLRTVGPATVGRYLGFALGAGCGEEEWDGQRAVAARGMEEVGRALPRSLRGKRQDEEREEDFDNPDSTFPPPSLPASSTDEHDDYMPTTGHRDSTASTDSRPEDDVKVGSLPSTSSIPPPSPSAGAVISPTAVHRTISNASTIRAPSSGLGMARADQTSSAMSSPSCEHRSLPHSLSHPSSATATAMGTAPAIRHSPRSGAPGLQPQTDEASETSIDIASMPHFYGFASNKIGEACACWLARWSSDLLASEQLSEQSPESSASGPEYRIFRHRGIPATFLRGLLSSDSFWVEGGEMGRYRLARDILDLRRKGWEAEMDEYEAARHVDEEEDDVREEDWAEWEEDEVELARVFAEGIYYAHMSFDDLSIIANDIDPTTHLPYAPLPVLQAAHWAAADLKSRILASDPASLTSTTAAAGAGILSTAGGGSGVSMTGSSKDHTELGLAVTASELADGIQRSQRRITPRSRVVSPALGSSGSRRDHIQGISPSSLYSGSPNASSSSIRLASPSANTITARPASKDAMYHPIPLDDTHRAGAGGLLSLTSPTAAAPTGIAMPMLGVPDLGPNLALSASGQSQGIGGAMSEDDFAAGTGGGVKRRLPPADEKTCFGLMNGSRTVGEIVGAISASTDKSHVPAFYSAFQHPSPSPALSPNIHIPSSPNTSTTTPLALNPAQARWTPTQPFRFSVEFWDVDKLAEKERLYSTTHFHAGSWWNVYVQTIRKKDKGTQLGVYLHRQSLAEGVPRASAPALDTHSGGAAMTAGHAAADVRAGPGRPGHHAAAIGEVLEGRGTREDPTGRRNRRSEGDIVAPSNAAMGTASGRAGSFRGAAAPSGLAVGTPPGAGALSSSMRRAGTADRGGVQGESPGDLIGEETYRDTRRVTRAYFSIACASALGTALIRFSSSPDNFTLSQSWGWKSSALKSEEYLAVSPLARPTTVGVPVEGESLDKGVLGWVGEVMPPGASQGVEGGMKGSLRATVVMGVV